MKKTKVCTKCHQEKPLSEFSKAKTGKFGVRGDCQECRKSPRIKEKEHRLSLVPKGFKLCSKCNKELPITEFWNDKKTSDGLNNWCISCSKEDKKRYNLEYKSEISANKRNYYLLNKYKISNYKKEFVKKNKNKIREYLVKYRQENKIELSKKKHEKYLKNKDTICRKAKDYYQKNKQLCNKRKLERNNLRRKTDVGFRIKSNLRGRISRLLGQNKSKSSIKLIGCSIEFLKKYLEGQFTEGMIWSKYGKGGWVVDHIKPCASFDLSKPSEQRKCFHYTNLQPLWEVDNLQKSDKLL